MSVVKDILIMFGLGASAYALYVIGFAIYAIARLMIKGDE